MAKRQAKLAIGALIGAGIGYAAGILTAPKSGRETRHDIQKAASKAKSEAERSLKHVHSELDTLIEKGKRQFAAAGSKAQAGFEDALHKAQSAKEKARELLSALHEGEADDKDLQKAVTETKNALSHLKKFVQKPTPKKG